MHIVIILMLISLKYIDIFTKQQDYHTYTYYVYYYTLLLFFVIITLLYLNKCQVEIGAVALIELFDFLLPMADDNISNR